MTERELFEAIGHVDDDLILAADAPVKKRRRVVHLHWQQVVSVAACACIVLGGAAVWRSGTLRKSSIASEAAMAADVPEAAAETAPAPDMPMLDAAAPGVAAVPPRATPAPAPQPTTLTDFDRQLIAATQAGMPLVPRPYEAVAAVLGATSAAVRAGWASCWLPGWCAALPPCPTTTAWATLPTA